MLDEVREADQSRDLALAFDVGGDLPEADAGELGPVADRRGRSRRQPDRRGDERDGGRRHAHDQAEEEQRQ
ncbi:hypothetical protein ACFQL4_05570 [Halosimplex aquaticum]